MLHIVTFHMQNKQKKITNLLFFFSHIMVAEPIVFVTMISEKKYHIIRKFFLFSIIVSLIFHMMKLSAIPQAKADRTLFEE